MKHDDAFFLQCALDQARQAEQCGEVPVGAVVVHEGRVIGRGYNRPLATHDPSAHAEIVALREAATALGNYRLAGCTLYVTLEPCPMCVGAILHARLQRVVWGAPDPKAGACGSVVDLAGEPRLNHHTHFEGGLMAAACGDLLSRFFAARRTEGPSRKVLRTPDSAFAGLEGVPFAARHLGNLPGIEHVRLHYIDAGPRTGGKVFVCVHGRWGWSQVFHQVIATLAEAGHRALALDLIGHGKSDKFADEAAYAAGLHGTTLRTFLERLDLRDAVLVCQDWAEALLEDWPAGALARLAGVLVLDPALPEAQAAAVAGVRTVRMPGAARTAGADAAAAAVHRAPYPDDALQAAWRAGARPWLSESSLPHDLALASDTPQFVPLWGKDIALRALKEFA